MGHSSNNSDKKCCGCGSSSDLHEYSVWAAESIDGISVRGKMETLAVPICRKCELADTEVAKRRSRSFRIALTCTAVSLLGLLLVIPLFEWAIKQKDVTVRLKGGLGASQNNGLAAVGLFSITFGFAPVYAWKHWLRVYRRTFGALAVVRKVAPKGNKNGYRVFGPGHIVGQNADGGVVNPDPAFSPYILAYDVAMQPVSKPTALETAMAQRDSVEWKRQQRTLGITVLILLGCSILFAVLGGLRNRHRHSDVEIDRSVQDVRPHPDVPRTPKAHLGVRVENKSDVKTGGMSEQ